MVTCRLSHRIESLGDDGVGTTLVAVVVGGGVCVAVAVGTDWDSLLVVQVVRMNNPMSKKKGNFFDENMCAPPPILIRRTFSLVSSQFDLAKTKRPAIDGAGLFLAKRICRCFYFSDC